MHLAKEIDANIMESELLASWGSTVSTASFKRMVNAIVKPFGAKAIIKRERLKRPKVMQVSGYFWAEKRGAKIILFYHIDHCRKSIHLDTRLLNRVIFLTSQTLQHELIHQSQEKRLKTFYTKNIPVIYSKKIKKKREENIKYLSIREEVDSYAQNIAMEMLYYHPDESPLKVYKNIDNRYLPSYQKYKYVFKNVDWTILKKELLKKVWKWIPKVSAPPHLTKRILPTSLNT